MGPTVVFLACFYGGFNGMPLQCIEVRAPVQVSISESAVQGQVCEGRAIGVATEYIFNVLDRRWLVMRKPHCTY